MIKNYSQIETDILFRPCRRKMLQYLKILEKFPWINNFLFCNRDLTQIWRKQDTTLDFGQLATGFHSKFLMFFSKFRLSQWLHTKRYINTK